MTALSAGHNPASGVSPLPSTCYQKIIKSAEVIYRNAVVAKDSNGQWVEAVGTDASLVCHGFARLDQGADSITGDGTKELKVDSGCKRLTGSGLSEANEGSTVYVVDDQTFSLSSNGGARPVMGLLMKVHSSTSGDVAIDPMLSALLTAADIVSSGASTELTIASGAITVTGSHHTVDTESDGASDNLDTIAGMEAGRLYLLRPASASRTVVIRDNSVGSGNIYTPFSQSISLAEAEDWAVLVSDGTKLSVVGFRTKAADGGGAGTIIGLLSALTTTTQASIVAAINELVTGAKTAQYTIPVNIAGAILAAGTPMAAFADDAGASSPGITLANSEAVGLRWNNFGTQTAVWLSVPMPQDLDDTAALVLHALVSKTGATLADATTLTVTAFFQTVGALHDADTNCGGTSSAVTGDATAKTVSELTLSIAAGDVPPSPSNLSFSVKPTDGTLGTDDFIIHALWFEGTRKILTS